MTLRLVSMTLLTQVCVIQAECDDTELLDNLHSFLQKYYDSQLIHPPTTVVEPFMMGLLTYNTELVQQYVNDVDTDLFSVAYVSGFIARRVLHSVRCDKCKACHTPPVMSTTAVIYFKRF
jgi:hypothetical protein